MNRVNKSQSKNQKLVECSYCHEKGHMIRECKVLAAKEAKQKMFLKKPMNPVTKVVIKTNTNVPKKYVSKFAMLDSDDESDEDEKRQEEKDEDEEAAKERRYQSYVKFFQGLEKYRGMAWADITDSDEE